MVAQTLAPTSPPALSRPGAARVRVFGQLRVHSYAVGGGWFVPDDCAPVDRPLLLVWARGGAVLRRRGGSIAAPPDALCFMANDGPLQLAELGPGGAVLLELPALVSARARERIDAATRCAITRTSGAPAFLRSFVDTLDRQPPSYCPENSGWVQACVCDITERVLAECAGSQPTAGERALLAAKDHISTHLTDLDLTPDRVAHAAAVSLRTLNRLFAAEGDSIGGWIRRQRLEHCRADLLDPGKAARSIGQIGALWGFLDAAHFSRAFKDAYGCSPRACRAAAIADLQATADQRAVADQLRTARVHCAA